MFWIHAGGYQFGSGNTALHGPDYLITEDVVVVTINYRLGLLGIHSLDILICRYNILHLQVFLVWMILVLEFQAMQD